MRLYRRRPWVWKLPAVSNSDCGIIEAAHDFCQSIASSSNRVLRQKDDNIAVAKIIDRPLTGTAVIEFGALDPNNLKTRGLRELSSPIG